MHRPPYGALRGAYLDRRSVPAKELYRRIGHSELAKAVGWENTCGLRMSLALVRVGVHVAPGRLLVRDGECKGSMLEPGQAALSRFLVHAWGAPEKYPGNPAAAKGITGRHGVISFFHLWGTGDRQGHIDLVAPYGGDNLMCAEDCYWMSTEVWFWPLK